MGNRSPTICLNEHIPRILLCFPLGFFTLSQPGAHWFFLVPVFFSGLGIMEVICNMAKGRFSKFLAIFNSGDYFLVKMGNKPWLSSIYALSKSFSSLGKQKNFNIYLLEGLAILHCPKCTLSHISLKQEAVIYKSSEMKLARLDLHSSFHFPFLSGKSLNLSQPHFLHIIKYNWEYLMLVPATAAINKRCPIINSRYF